MDFDRRRFLARFQLSPAAAALAGRRLDVSVAAVVSVADDGLEIRLADDELQLQADDGPLAHAGSVLGARRRLVHLLLLLSLHCTCCRWQSL